MAKQPAMSPFFCRVTFLLKERKLTKNIGTCFFKSPEKGQIYTKSIN
jgi:hypothetical protein